MNIQSLSAYVSAAAGATPGASIADLAQEHGVSREALADHALERDGGHGSAPAERGAAGSYTASAQRTPDRAAAPGHISILA